MVAYTVTPALGRWRQKYQEYKVIIGQLQSRLEAILYYTKASLKKINKKFKKRKKNTKVVLSFLLL